jgi:flagellar biosynthesis/type III secretory pathway protein FliH
MPAVKLAKPIESLKVIQNPTTAASMNDTGQDISEELESRNQQCAQALQTLEAITANLQLVYEKAIIEHRQGIAKLAVEIARKVLAQKVKEGDYRIESIIQEALNNAPTRQEIVVRLNAQDLTRCQQTLQQFNETFAGIKFIADPGIEPAQCVVDTPKGKIESLINENLEQVERALSKVV